MRTLVSAVLGTCISLATGSFAFPQVIYNDPRLGKTDIYDAQAENQYYLYVDGLYSKESPGRPLSAFTGRGVTVQVRERSDLIEFWKKHPDLVNKCFTKNQAENSVTEHATEVAGIIAMEGGNRQFGIGVAPGAMLATGRDNGNFDVRNESFVHTFLRADHVTCLCLWDSSRDGQYDTLPKGQIVVVAAGNQNRDAEELAGRNKPGTIVVGALREGDLKRWVSGGFGSNFGANLFCCAPSTHIGTTSFTAVGRKTGPPKWKVEDEGGTSLATPQVSGIMALGKQASNGALNTRLAKQLLARTSKKIDVGSPLWQPTGGLKMLDEGQIEFNPNYGFGLPDAAAFTRQAGERPGYKPANDKQVGHAGSRRRRGSACGMIRPPEDRYAQLSAVAPRRRAFLLDGRDVRPEAVPCGLPVAGCPSRGDGPGLPGETMDD